MFCPICENDNLTDYPLCPTCAERRHFPNRTDCHCIHCVARRREEPAIEREVLGVIARDGELRIFIGSPVQAAA